MGMRQKNVVAFDMDGVIASWEPMNNRVLSAINKDHPMIQEVREDYNLMTGDPVLDAQMRQAMDTPGTYRNLEPVPGARDALYEMMDYGIEVYICTTPHVTNPTCASDKVEWLFDVFGEKIARRCVQTQDKTLCRADLLIDDKPKITGMFKPTWQHVLYDQPYNRHVTDLERIYGWTPGVVPALVNLLEKPRATRTRAAKKELVFA